MQSHGVADETPEERIERLKTYVKLYQYPPIDKDLYDYARYNSIIPGTEPYVGSPGEEDILFNQWQSDRTNKTKNKNDVKKENSGVIALIKKFIGLSFKRTQTISTSNQSIFHKNDKNNDYSVDVLCQTMLKTRKMDN